jgi:spore maturation protein CgeB
MTMHLETFTAQSGSLSARVATDDWARHLHSTVAPEREHEYFSDLEVWGDIVVLAGTGLGYHLARALRTLPSPVRLVAIEYFPKLADHVARELLSALPNPTTVVSGPDPRRGRDTLRAAVGGRPDARVQVIRHPASYAVNREYYRAVLEALGSQSASPPAMHASTPTALLMHGSFFLEEELKNALAEAGVAAAAFPYREYATGFAYESALQRALQEHKPDFVLSVNMKGFDGEGVLAECTGRAGVPVVVWFVDDPRPILLNQRRHVQANMIAACWERAYIPALEREAFGSVRYLPLAADPSLFAFQKKQAPTVDLGFVGSSMGEEFLGPLRQKFLWRPALQPLADRAAEMLLGAPGKPAAECIAGAARELGTTPPFTDERNRTWLASYVIHTAGGRRRAKLIEALLPHGVELFGDPAGWRALFGDRAPVHPNIDYRTGLGGTYRSIAVNLNITSAQMPTAVNQRVFDIPLTGSFVLSDDRADLAELFGPDEVAVYADRAELVDKARFYRDNPSAREAITAAARARILGQHTYRRRIEELLGWVGVEE